ncbi:MAG: UPF0280 family protein [Deltaproteobacteria bacterium]|nr:UPF0280 family protein [Deltaproteobacteria bacterium]
MQAAQRVQNTNYIQVLPNGTNLVDYGPMRMSINVSENGKPLPKLAEEGALLVMSLLEDLSKCLSIINRKNVTLGMKDIYPEIVRRMIEATQKIEEPDLTPLAAVAGTASEMVADFIFNKGGTKVIVDNGGDIAIRLREGEVARVGVKTEISAKQPAYLISIDSTMGIGGVATSGFGGRSFTKGIASAATVLAERASLADAAATVIGNFTNVDDPNITRTLAERIYPDTDIAGEWVTTRMGELSQEKIEQALNNGLSKASVISKKQLIYGALIALKGKTVWTDSLAALVEKL